jgi:hypothetical protein
MTTDSSANLVARVVLLLAKGPLRSSSIGETLFPVTTDKDGHRLSGARNPQGAALSAGKWIRKAQAAGYICRDYDTRKWKVTSKGEQQAKEWSKGS